MAITRSLADIQEEYDAARRNYLLALEQTQASMATGSGSTSFSRDRPEQYRAEMRALQAEYAQVQNGGICVVGGVPSD